MSFVRNSEKNHIRTWCVRSVWRQIVVLFWFKRWSDPDVNLHFVIFDTGWQIWHKLTFELKCELIKSWRSKVRVGFQASLKQPAALYFLSQSTNKEELLVLQRSSSTSLVLLTFIFIFIFIFMLSGIMWLFTEPAQIQFMTQHVDFYQSQQHRTSSFLLLDRRGGSV